MGLLFNKNQYITLPHARSCVSSSTSSAAGKLLLRRSGRERVNKLTKENIIFLQSLGFRMKKNGGTATNIRRLKI